MSFAVSVAFEAVSFAASLALAVVDSNLRAARPGSFVDCRSTVREMADDMVRFMRANMTGGMTLSMLEAVVGEQLVGVVVVRCRSTIFRDSSEVGLAFQGVALQVLDCLHKQHTSFFLDSWQFNF